MLGDDFVFQIGDIVRTTMRVGDLPADSEGIVEHFLDGGLGSLVMVDFDLFGLRYVRPSVLAPLPPQEPLYMQPRQKFTPPPRVRRYHNQESN